MINRVLLLSASAGAGHIRAADAIRKAFAAEGGAGHVEHVDVLKHSSRLMRDLYATTYFKMASVAPELLGWFYTKTDRPWRYQRRRVAFDRLNLGGVIRMIRKAEPDLVICTHFTPAEVVSWLKEKGELRCPHAVVVTDLDAHGIWLVRRAERYYVALEETRQYLAALKVPADRIRVTGIPIDRVFTVPRDGRAMRRKHGIPAGVPAVMVSAGGFGIGNVEDVVRPLLGMPRPATLVVMCGRNESLKARIARLAPRRGRVRLLAVGFTTEMDEYMAACDVMVGKPGGLTMSESLARGLPFVIVNPIPGQEERNSDHLLEEGAAIRCNNFPVLGWKVAGLLADRRKLAALRAGTRRLAKPFAAREIVRDALRLRPAAR